MIRLLGSIALAFALIPVAILAAIVIAALTVISLPTLAVAVFVPGPYREWLLSHDPLIMFMDYFKNRER